MKKFIAIISMLFLLTVNPLFSQVNASGTRVNVGTGIWGNSPIIMPLNAGMEFGLSEDIAIGFDIEWRLYSDGWNHSVFAFQARGDYYFDNLIGFDNTWDVYAGLQMGPSIITKPSGYPGTREGFNWVVDGYVGGRWWFSEAMALNAQVGLTGVFPDIVGPAAFMNFGLTFGL